MKRISVSKGSDSISRVSVRLIVRLYSGAGENTFGTVPTISIKAIIKHGFRFGYP
jgi:hypothetical protein